MEKTIEFKDFTLQECIDDGLVCKGDMAPNYTGLVVIKDIEGNVLLRKKNLVVLRGRTFSLEKLFNLTIPNEVSGSYISNTNRSVCLFRAGTNGTLVGQPFQPTAVNYDEEGLSVEVPFRSLAVGEEFSIDPIDESVYYTDERIVGVGEDEVRHYYSKRLNIDSAFKPVWEFNKDTNTAYIKTTLKIGASDFRGEKINELGLFFADQSGDTFTDMEMFSRITFDTESFPADKELTIEYYIFV